MSGVNRHILVGHLGRDPEGRPLANGGKVVTFSLAVSEQWRDRASGEKRQSTSWHQVVIFSEPLGETAMKFLKKGSHAYVEGEVLTRSYEKDGATRYVTETVLRPFRGALVLLDRAEKPPAPGEASYGASAAPPDSDVPF